MKLRNHRRSAILISSMLASVFLAAGCGTSNPPESPVVSLPDPNPVIPPFIPDTDCAVARVVTGAQDLVNGPLARGRVGDVVIENRNIRVIIQKGGRNWFSIAQFGGNIIDAARKNPDGTLATLDNYEESVLGTNIESAPNYQEVFVQQAGGENPDGSCIPAIVRAEGENGEGAQDDLLDFVNGSSAIRDLGFMFPDAADDVDLPLTFRTDYTLNTNENFVTMDTTAINDTGAAVPIFMVEYMNGAGEVEFFQHGYGFGEPLLTSPCDSCNVAIYNGHEGAAGISYGIVHQFPTTTSLSVSGVSILVYGTDALQIALLGNIPAPFSVPANGELNFQRFFVIGDGSVASVLDVKHQIFGEATGTLSGQVTDSNGPVANAEIAVITTDNDFAPFIAVPRGPSTIVANHFRTDANGRYSGTLRPGTYELRINGPNRLAGTPSVQSVDITADATTTQDFTLPLPARIRVQVVDENSLPVAAKVQLIGLDASPDAAEPLNGESILGQVETESGFFGDANADPRGAGIVFTEYAVADPTKTGAVTVGDTGVFEIEPGTYQLSVSRGIRYSEHTEEVVLTEGQLTQVTARVVQVVDTPNYIFGDFHVHAFNSPDSEVTNRERVAAYLSEDMDFFTPSDHGMRVDFVPIVADMGVGNRIASAPSAENTTFDYGHINAWPVAVDGSPASTDEASQSDDPKTALGSVDWGGAAPVGQDFPSQNNFGLTPAQIFAEAKNDAFSGGRETVVQINHVEGHFALGLEIDTGVVPPQSAKDPAERRLDPAETNLFDESLGFDALELWIGVDGRVHQFDHLFGENLGDWFNMLNQGIVKTFVSNSDTHERRLNSFATRNMISAPASLLNGASPNFTALRTNPHDLGDQVIAGRSVATNSLMLEVKALNQVPQQAGLEISDAFGTDDAPLPSADGEIVDLNISIRAPDWAEYDEILIYVNGETVRTASDPLGLTPATPARYLLCEPTATLNVGAVADAATFTRETVVAATVNGTDFSRFETNVSVPIVSPSEDYWVVVIARGNDGVSLPMWPMYANDYVKDPNGDGDLTNRQVTDTGMPALAITNPIFVDVDGNGTWDAPGVATRAHQLQGDNCPGGGLPLPFPENPLPFP